MKKTYVAPVAEKINFEYKDQVVATSGCTNQWINTGDSSCDSQDKYKSFLQN